MSRELVTPGSEPFSCRKRETCTQDPSGHPSVPAGMGWARAGVRGALLPPSTRRCCRPLNSAGGAWGAGLDPAEPQAATEPTEAPRDGEYGRKWCPEPHTAEHPGEGPGHVPRAAKAHS